MLKWLVEDVEGMREYRGWGHLTIVRADIPVEIEREDCY